MRLNPRLSEFLRKRGDFIAVCADNAICDVREGVIASGVHPAGVFFGQGLNTQGHGLQFFDPNGDTVNR